jgi:hypothetical protein
MSYTFEFEIPELPKPINRQMSMHWTAKGEYVRSWHAQVAAHIGKNKPAAPLKKARLTLIRFSSTEPDFDGLVSSFKPVLDGLIKCGVLEDDKPSNIGKSSYEWEYAKAKQGKIKVKIEGVE